jgi:hypothetical protein
MAQFNLLKRDPTVLQELCGLCVYSTCHAVEHERCGDSSVQTSPHAASLYVKACLRYGKNVGRQRTLPHRLVREGKPLLPVQMSLQDACWAVQWRATSAVRAALCGIHIREELPSEEQALQQAMLKRYAGTSEVLIATLRDAWAAQAQNGGHPGNSS